MFHRLSFHIVIIMILHISMYSMDLLTANILQVRLLGAGQQLQLHTCIRPSLLNCLHVFIHYLIMNKLYRLVWINPKTNKKMSNWWTPTLETACEDKDAIEAAYGIKCEVEEKEV